MKTISHTPHRVLSAVALALTLLAIAQGAFAGTPLTHAPVTAPTDSVSWKEHTISPVANFVNFEDPVIRTEIRPVYAFHNIPGNFITGGRHAQAAGVQVRFAVTDRLALFINQGGYIQVDPALGNSFGGWADLGLGIKYTLIDD